MLVCVEEYPSFQMAKDSGPAGVEGHLEEARAAGHRGIVENHALSAGKRCLLWGCLLESDLECNIF